MGQKKGISCREEVDINITYIIAAIAAYFNGSLKLNVSKELKIWCCCRFWYGKIVICDAVLDAIC